MIFDRRRIYLIGAVLSLLVLVLVYATRPQISPDQRVREQVAMLAHEPWTLVRIQDEQFVGTSEPDQVILRAVRLDTGEPITVGFLSRSPYTSPATMQRLREQELAGRVGEALLLPLPMAEEPYRSEFKQGVTHVGVVFFAGLPEWTAKVRTETPEAGTTSGLDAGRNVPVPRDTTAAPARNSGQPG